MTFEEQVRAALESLLIQQQGEDSPNPENWDSGYAAHQANYLAPRVAAAIEAAIKWSHLYPVGTAFEEMSGEQRSTFLAQQGGAAALAALRGQP